MTLRSRSLRRLLWRTLVVGLAALFPAAAAAGAQTRWTIDPKTSLAWWQVNPNLNHLWATTCPRDPSWRPGEGRSPGWRSPPPSKEGFANVQDTVRVPRYPRRRVRPTCTEAVRGEILVGDTVQWRGVRGEVAIRSDALATGEDMRDVMMWRVMETAQHPEMHFTLDSLVDVTKQADTLLGSAVGTFTLRGVPWPATVAVKAFPDAGGMRVLAKWRVKATALEDLIPGLVRWSAGLSLRLWKDFFMGADLVFRPEATGAN